MHFSSDNKIIMKYYVVALIALCMIAQIACSDEQCKDGETKREDCNMCRCINGEFACTKKRCINSDNKPCQDGEIFKEDCNTCRCIKGNFACTKKMCPEMKCNEGDMKQDDCNKCWCINGQWGCTLKAC